MDYASHAPLPSLAEPARTFSGASGRPNESVQLWQKLSRKNVAQAGQANDAIVAELYCEPAQFAVTSCGAATYYRCRGDCPTISEKGNQNGSTLLRKAQR